MKKITITFADPNETGWIKATVYENTNKYLVTAWGYDVTSALLNVSDEIAKLPVQRGMNESLGRRD